MKTSDLLQSQLTQEPGLTGRELARRLSMDKSAINSELFKLKSQGLAWQDSEYKWFPGSAKRSGSGGPAVIQNTVLARLCRYYLQCLSLDDQGGVSLFAKSKYSPEYVELPIFPSLDSEDRPLGSHPGVSSLFQSMRRSTARKAPFLGYPVRVKRIVSKKGWEGYLVEPVLLFDLDEEAMRAGGDPEFGDEPPVFNAKVLTSFSMGSEANVMEEAARLGEELGLAGTSMPELDDLMLRLQELRDGWDWKEPCDPHQLTKGVPLSGLQEEGIYNRAIVFGCERSPYTKGLEQELVKLQGMSEEHVRGTALGAWLAGDFSRFQAPRSTDRVLLEPLPLNSEQREAVEKALTRPLTVITGPPGTGKSQVVSSILVNAAQRGLRVVFASKNNKAVDVVETRVNGLGPRPVLLRLGRGEHQTALLQYLTGLLSGRVTEDDRLALEEAEREYNQLSARIMELRQRAEQCIALRNQVDAEERKLEPVRKTLGEDLLHRLPSLNLDQLAKASGRLRTAALAASKQNQRGFTRLFWPWIKAPRLEALRQVAKEVIPTLQCAEVPIPKVGVSDASTEEWAEAANSLQNRVHQAHVVSSYRGLLKALMTGDRLEELNLELAELTTRTADHSRRVWQAWLRLAPARLSTTDRKNLGDFCAVLRLLSQSDEQGSFAGKEVFAQYYKLYPKLLDQLNCWAVTALSARGRVPLEPGFFDLLVIDEASQCDIASALPLLYRAKAAVIIGDPQQLQHISSISPRRDKELLAKFELLAEHIRWMYSINSLFDLAAPLVSEDQVLLRDHHRSHADIIEFSNNYFYSGGLRVATRYDRLRSVAGNLPAVRWIHVKGQVTRPGGSSAMNEQEAQAVVKELERIALQQGYQGTIGIVTPFRAQVNRIRDIIHSHPQSGLLLAIGDLLVDTAHKFQGDERDVIIFSPVLSEGAPKSATGFLQGTPNLFNVAITRARASLVVVGDRKAAKSGGVEYLAEFSVFLDDLGRTHQEATSPVQQGDLGSAYPAVSRPELVSDWERTFYSALYEADLRPIPQFDVEKYTLDFAMLKGEARLNIEVDGERYHRDWNGELLRRDQIRNMRMIELGWDVMRFWVYELRDEMPTCVARVKRWMDQSL